MKKRFRIIIVAFSISFILMGGLSILALGRLEQYTKFSNDVDHINEVIRKLFKLEGYLKDVDKAERGFMLTFDTTYSNTLTANIDSLTPAITAVKKLTGDNKLQQRNLVLLQSGIAIRVGLLKQNMGYVNTFKTHEPSGYYFEGKKESSMCTERINAMHNQETKLFTQKKANERFYQQLTSNGLNSLLLFFFASALCLFFFLITELKKRMEYQHKLQSKIVNLERSHSELEQIAYAASHDFQEPLRKIQVFSNRLLWIKKGNIDDETKSTIDRISVAAGRLQELIEDLLVLTELIKDNGKKQSVNIGIPLQMAISDLAKKIGEKSATINIETLPYLKVNPSHIHILFKALLDNSLKFAKDNVSPVISITADMVKGDDLIDIDKKLAARKFQRITLKDNGIGFENKFSAKMFHIFQRLHNQYSKYDGKGIGLAVCQRIMANHEGYILAYGHPEMGATFKLYFPVDE